MHQSTYWQNGSNFFSFKDEGIESEEEVSRSRCGAQRAHDVGFAGTLAGRRRLVTHRAGGAANVAVTGATAIAEVKASRLGGRKVRAIITAFHSKYLIIIL